MKKIFFIFLLFISISYGMSYLGIVIDSKNLKNGNYKKISKLIKKVIQREQIRQDKLIFEIFDIRSGNIIYSVFKLKNQKIKKKIIKHVLKKLSKKTISGKAKLDKVLYNIRINTLFSEIISAKIYFIESLLTDNETINFNQNYGFPNKICLEENIPLVYNKPFRNNLNTQIFVWNDKNRFTSQYIYYFYNLFKKFNLSLKEYREDSVILTSNNLNIIPIKLTNVNLPDGQVCKLSDGIVSLTNMAEDKIDISEPHSGIVVVKGYNKNRANSTVEIKFNNKNFYVRADSEGNYKKEFNLTPGSNTIDVKMMDNKYKRVYAKNYQEDVEDKYSCKIVGNHIIVEGTNKFRKVGSNVEIIYDFGKRGTAVVDKNHHYKLAIPIPAKITNISIIQLDGKSLECTIKANVKSKDSIYSSVKNMTAEICVVNPDRHSNKITYKYENENNREVTREAYRKGNRLCFKIPLKYDRVHNFEIKQLDGNWKSYQIVLDRLPTNFVRIRMSFNCDSDVDLHVLEPVSNNGKKREVYYDNKRNYGELDVDSRKKSQGPENYVLDLTNAPKGRYYYWVVWYSRLDKFKKYHNKSCDVRLEIVENGKVKIKPIHFFPVPYTTNKFQQEKDSVYPVDRKLFYFDVR